MKTLSISLLFIFGLLAGNLYGQNLSGKSREKVNSLNPNARGGHVPASLEHHPASSGEYKTTKTNNRLEKKLRVKKAAKVAKPRAKKTQGLGAAIASLVLAVVGIALLILSFFFFSHAFGIIGIVLGVAALILGIICLIRGGGGFILALLGLIFAIIVIGLFIAVLVAILL